MKLWRAGPQISLGCLRQLSQRAQRFILPAQSMIGDGEGNRIKEILQKMQQLEGPVRNVCRYCQHAKTDFPAVKDESIICQRHPRAVLQSPEGTCGEFKVVEND